MNQERINDNGSYDICVTYVADVQFQCLLLPEYKCFYWDKASCDEEPAGKPHIWGLSIF